MYPILVKYEFNNQNKTEKFVSRDNSEYEMGKAFVNAQNYALALIKFNQTRNVHIVWTPSEVLNE